MVLARNEFDPQGELQVRRVLRKFVRVAPIWNLHIADKIIGTTAEHPFYVLDKGWMPAIELRIGDLLQSSDGKYLPVEGIADSGRVETVYNVEIEGDHTYFIGEVGWGWDVWAHNAAYERWMSKAEYESFLAKKGFTGRPGHPGNPVRIAQAGTIDPTKLAKDAATKYSNRLLFDLNRKAIDWLKKHGVEEAGGHPGSFAIPQGLLEEFNKFVRNARLGK